MDAVLAKYSLSRGVGRPIRRWLARPFPRSARHRLLILYHPAAIPFVQLHPFLVWQQDMYRRFGTAVRARPGAPVLDGEAPTDDLADTILFGPWFTEPPARVAAALERLRTGNPQAVIAFVDSYAANDLRLGQAADPYIDWYLKKSLFKDRRLYSRDFRGDTNLTEYYGDLYGIAADPVAWNTPETLWPKLRLSPNFLTARQFLTGFPAGECPGQAGRALDVQTRLGRKGTPWYSAMRDEAIARTDAIPGITRSPTGRISYDAYMDEMRNARLCFSPFGYGELCWRDIEAFQTGSVLIKPDMSHLDTLPDLYEPGVTYLPVKWDFSDLEDVVRAALADEDLRSRLASEAYARCSQYLTPARFMDDMKMLFPDPLAP